MTVAKTRRAETTYRIEKCAWVKTPSELGGTLYRCWVLATSRRWSACISNRVPSRNTASDGRSVHGRHWRSCGVLGCDSATNPSCGDLLCRLLLLLLLWRRISMTMWLAHMGRIPRPRTTNYRSSMRNRWIRSPLLLC